MQVFTILVAALAGCVSSEQQKPLRQQSLEEIPLLGYGTWNLKSPNTSEAVAYAIETGYRHIDAAKIYGNQVAVGQGIKDGLSKAKLQREDIWVTSKLWNNRHGASNVRPALDETLEELGLDYLDLYLMHWPVSQLDGKTEMEFLETWDAMTDLVESGKAKHVGVSNFSPKQLKKLLKGSSKVKPYAHQFELHPYLQQTEWVDWHKSQGIHVTAYSPLGNMNPTYESSRKAIAALEVPPLLSNDLIMQIANDRGCTPAQVALQWGMQRETSVIPKSVHASYIEENFQSSGCKLRTDDLDRIAKELPTKRLNNPSKGWGVCLYEGLEDASSCSSSGSGRSSSSRSSLGHQLEDVVMEASSFTVRMLRTMMGM